VQLGERLRYQDVRRVAVVAGANVPRPIPNPLPPCGVCCEMLHKLNEAEGQIQLYMLAARDSTRVVRIALSEYYPPRLPR
jgi:cytidine deaminase